MPVYIIRSGAIGHVKIGFTSGDVAKRLRGLQTSHPQKLRILRVLDGGRAAEKTLHERFAHLRQAGEWFSFDAAMLADLGLADLPVPLLGKRKDWGKDTAWARERAVHQDIVLSQGGEEAFARRLRCAPWVALDFGTVIRHKYFSAAALIAQDNGLFDVTVDLLLELRNAVTEEAQKEAASRHESEAQRFVRFEKDWVKKHGPSAAWWQLAPENEAHSCAMEAA